MKICMFTNTYLPHVGGVARSVNIFAEDLRKMGHRVLVVAPIYPDCGKHDKDEPDILRTPAIQHFNGSDFSMRIPAPFHIDEKMDEFEPDIIHSHHPYLLGDAALRAARRRGLPLVFTHHTLYEQYTHYVTGDSENMKRFASILSTEYANMCDRVAAPGKSIEDLIRKRGVVTKIEEIPTGVDVDFFSRGDGKSFRERHGISESAFVIGHLGRLAPEKNLGYLAGAVSHAMTKLDKTCFLVAGDGPSRSDMLEIFENKGLADRLIFSGNVTGKMLADAYRAMDLFVFASRSETQGMVLTEAMASGVPVIALDAPGAREVVRDGENGALLPGDSFEKAFSDAVRDAVTDSEKLSAWCRETGRTARAFSRTTCSERLFQFYEAAIAETGASPSKSLEETDPWDDLLLAIQTEWELIAQKAKAVLQTARESGELKDLV